MKQTAVEWLVEQIKDYDFADIKDNEYYFIQIPTWILKEKIEQAKAMEKEQIIEAYKYGNLSNVYYKPERLFAVSGSLPPTKCKCGQNALPYKAQIEIDKCSRCGNEC